MKKKITLTAETEGELGPAMLALPNDRWREFTRLVAAGELIRNEKGTPDYAECAKRAGFADNGTSMIRVQVHRLVHDERFQAAVKEESERRVNALLPFALTAAAAILADPEHRYHGKMVERMMTQGGLIPKNITEHKVEMSVDEEIKAIMQLAAETGQDAKKLLGWAGVTVDNDTGEVVEQVDTGMGEGWSNEDDV